MIELSGMSLAELKAWCAEQGVPAFRARQLLTWLHRGMGFSEMSNLPKELRESWAAQAVAQGIHIREKRISTLDGTAKFLYSLQDGNCVEGVLMHYHYGWSLCVSTQVGCAMGCAFCASTLGGCVRNLTAGEMLGEITCANRYLAEQGQEGHVGHVVLMGSGEPLDNYDEVTRFLRLLREPDGLNLSLRNVSLSTCGLVPQMRRFAQEGLPVTLSVSLHAPSDEIRRQLMPIARRYSMEEVLSACRYYIEQTGRRVIFEYALTDGVNADPVHARMLADRLRGMQCHVNLIPLNPVRERGLRGVTEKQVQAFLKALEDCHISATRRREMGDDIEGACGQLRRHVLQEEDPQS